MLRTKLDMVSVRADVVEELAEVIEAGVPLVYRENGVVVEVRKLATLQNSERPEEIHFSAAAE